MTRFRPALLLLLALASLHAQSNSEILQQLSEITGFKIRKPVPQDSMTRDQLKAYFNKRLAETVSPEELRLEELVLKRFGLVPESFDLKQSTLDLMTEQAAAFYDYRRGRMVILDGQSGFMQNIALIHELAHALADQHFDLDKYIRKNSAGDDALLARQAVMEGQATWLMSEIMVRRAGQSLRDSPAMVRMMSRMAGEGSGIFPVFDQSPLYLKESLLFPYAQGMLFQQAIVEKLGGAAFLEVFRKPPLTSQEILQPERYLERSASQTVQPYVKPAPPPDPKRWKLLTSGALGEFDHRILLRQYDPGRESAAARWTASNYEVQESKKDKSILLSYASRWESPEAAREIFEAYKTVLQGKWTRCQFAEETPTRVRGTGDAGLFELTLDGDTVRSLEGLPIN